VFLSLDGTFFVQLLNFAIFLAVLNIVFLRPVGRAIVKRREYINSVVADYDTYQAKAKALRDNDARLRAEARREAEHAIAKARAEASNETAKLAAGYAERVHSTIDEAQREVAQELDAARAGEERLVAALSDLMVERALSEPLR
jgi:F-type H+-transporting ATPase subunit b